MPDYTSLDTSSALTYIFYPRDTFNICPKWGFDIFVTVEKDTIVHCRFYRELDANPWILHFHGNGEVVSDYDEVSLFYLKNGINLVVVDYRGYGKSTGNPTLTAISRDAGVIYNAVRNELANRGITSRVWVMGRSLGSVPAIEIAHQNKEMVPGLIIESGFSGIARLLLRLGLTAETDLQRIDSDGIAMVNAIRTPVLIIHGEYDTLVPLEEAEVLNEQIGSEQKELVIIPGGTHNDIMFIGLKQYFEAIRRFIHSTGSKQALLS